jgi:GNAT superfamily N-acetyltransferase
MESTVTLLERRQLSEAADILAGSFHDEPAYRHLIPDPRRRPAALRAFLSAPLRDAQAQGSCWAATENDTLVGVAAWQPPGRYPWSTWRRLRALPHLLSAFRAAPSSCRDLIRFGSNIDRLFPQEPVWYLQALGVLPDHQRVGIGTQLLRACLQQADQDGRPCYLETTTPDAVRFYGRQGFEVSRHGLQLVPEGPTHWLMRRPSSGSAP